LEVEYTGFVPALGTYLDREAVVEAVAVEDEAAAVVVSVGKVNIGLGSILYMYAAKYLSSFLGIII
jgi:hypothetical protein